MIRWLVLLPPHTLPLGPVTIKKRISPNNKGFTTTLAPKNSVLLVEFADQQRDKGMGVSEAIKASAERRLRPVMMTLVSTVLGALPLILSSGAGAEGRNAIGWVVFGGLALAAVFTLYLTPLLYQALARFANARVAETRRLSDELAHATELGEQAN